MMKNEYTIECLQYGKEMECAKPFQLLVDPSSFHDVVRAVDAIADSLHAIDSTTEDDKGLTLRVYSENGHELFPSLEHYLMFKSEHRIEHRILSNWDLVMYINNIRYEGDITDLMRAENKYLCPACLHDWFRIEDPDYFGNVGLYDSTFGASVYVCENDSLRTSHCPDCDETETWRPEWAVGIEENS